MVRKDNIESKKGRPRGRPFSKGNKKGKLKDDISSYSELNSEGEIIDCKHDEAIIDENKKQEDVIEIQNKDIEILDQEIKKDEVKDLELIDKLEFKNGENTLTIRFSKKHNRMFRIQIFLNDESEIRPVTYTGASTGFSFWNLLKGALNK